ncbi:MAG: penicillin-binding protein 2, partial [Clostridium sp.]|nr:penicillin-binding protein 2 [Clostridium sp.]
MFKKNNKINNKRILLVSGLFSIISLFLVVRLYFLLIHPSKIVSGDIENYQYETIAQNKYKVLDANGRDLTKYNKKYILVLDTKPFMLNNYEETLEDLMALNFI